MVVTVTMHFELHTDASDFAIGGILMQDGHPIAFESQKLNEMERKYNVNLTALVEGTYYWPRMGDDVETFVRTCLIFQQDKMEQKKSEIHRALLDGVVQDHGDGFELLHEFSSLNEQANREGECTIGALSSALWKSPFELVTGRQPLTPNALVASYQRSIPTAYKTMKEWHEQADLSWASLDKAVKKMKKWADEKRRRFEFEVGDQVIVKLLPQQFKSLRKVPKGLIRRYEGPFPGDRMCWKDEEDPERGVSKRAPTAVVTSYDREAEEILSDRTIRRRIVSSYKEYLIKWCDLPDSEASWEAKDLLWQFTDEIRRYHEDGTTRTSRA
ncbi:reverse transcriptase [Tanacetum coccineum]